MDAYLVFVLIASALILSPGPGVVHTLSNSIRYGARGSISGILGIAGGTSVVAAVAATSLGLILTMSSLPFAVMKFVGAIYLIYLGIRRWRAPAIRIDDVATDMRGFWARFMEGALIQILNPKVILFFMAIFPQFIDHSSSYLSQFVILVSTYSLLVVLIHMLYAVMAEAARNRFASPAIGRMVCRASGATFVGFGISVATASR